MGLKRLINNLCIYYRAKDNIIIGLYVDDLLILILKNY